TAPLEAAATALAAAAAAAIASRCADEFPMAAVSCEVPVVSMPVVVDDAPGFEDCA
ncbi:hypothetical protein GGH99_007832, partial [Coemansia sp. RSA 1285]